MGFDGAGGVIGLDWPVSGDELVWVGGGDDGAGIIGGLFDRTGTDGCAGFTGGVIDGVGLDNCSDWRINVRVSDDLLACSRAVAKARLALQLLRGHVISSTHNFLRALHACTLGDERDTEIAQKDFAAPPDEHVLWLDVAVNELFVVGILQGVRDLLNVGMMVSSDRRVFLG